MMIPSKQKPPSPPSTQSGFTIIESLLAILIVSLLMVAIAPTIVLSVATRVQARRVELATAAARTYIDGVKAGTIPQPNSMVPVQAVPSPTVTAPGATVPVKTFLFTPTVSASQGPPATALNCPPPATDPQAKGFYCQNPPNPSDPANLNALSLYCINLDGNGCVSGGSNKNLVIQAFRSITPNSRDVNLPPQDLDGSKGYLLGVRVYRLDAFDGNSGSLETMYTTGGKKTAAYAMGGLGYKVGTRQAPLVEMTGEVRPISNANDPSSAYKDLCTRTGGGVCSP